MRNCNSNKADWSAERSYTAGKNACAGKYQAPRKPDVKAYTHSIVFSEKKCIQHFNRSEAQDNACHNRNHKTVSYTHLRAHETVLDLVCRLLLEKKKKK